jgi:hypothetical protein
VESLLRVQSEMRMSTLSRGLVERWRKEMTSNQDSDKDVSVEVIFRKRNESNPQIATQESPPALPAQPETPNDGHLAGLLTYASSSLKRLPGCSQWHSAQVLSEYSCGAVADSHRASHYQMEKSYIGEKKRGQGI